MRGGLAAPRCIGGRQAAARQRSRSRPAPAAFIRSRHGHSRAGNPKGDHPATICPNCPTRMAESPANLGVNPQNPQVNPCFRIFRSGLRTSAVRQHTRDRFPRRSMTR